MFSCRDVTEHASDHLEGKLAGMRGFRFRMHVFMCRNCRRYLAQLRRTLALLGALPQEPPSVATEEALVGAFRNAFLPK